MTTQTSIVFSQRTWTGVGDLDDCWVLSSIQSAHAVAPWLHLPTSPSFRKAAGDPDDGNKDGGSIAEIIRGVTTAWPDFEGKLTALRSVTPWTLKAAAAKGHPLSVALMLDKLPPELRYGSKAVVAHQCTIVQKGDRILFANPLAPMGSRWDEIEWGAVMPAIRAYGNGTCFAVAFPTPATMTPLAPGVADLVAAAHATPSPEALAAAKKAGYLAGFAEAKADAAKAVAAIVPTP